MRKRTLSTLLVATALAASQLVAPAASASSYTMALPNDCIIRGANQWSAGIKYATTTEVANCASIQVKLEWFDFNASRFRVNKSKYLASRSVYVDAYTPDRRGYSDHNGKNQTNGVAWGYRLAST